jgi:uncharacterized membrane protein
MAFINRIIHALTSLHPLHPMFVHFPIALTGAAFLFILLAWWRRSRLLEQAAFANMCLAAVATAAAGATGFYDSLHNYSGGAPNAMAKIVLATLLLILTSSLAIARWRNPRLFEGGWGKALYILGYGLSFALALVLAFLGAIILYGF